MLNYLFSPLKSGRLSLPNRIGWLAHRTNFAQKGRISDRQIAYYKRRATGGCGFMMIGELAVHHGDRPWQALVDASDTRVVSSYRELTSAISEIGTRVFANLNHHGFQSSGAITRRVCLAPSAESDVAYGEVAKPMEAEEIEEIGQAFAHASKLALDGGFEGVEIDMGPQSLLRQFLSPLSNHRTDVYGGSFENRMRFPLEVIHSVRKSIGSDVPLGIRLCADEMFWGALEPEQAEQMAVVFEQTGEVDFFNIAVGTYYNLHLQTASMHTTEPFALETTCRIKQKLNVPVIGGYQIPDPVKADQHIQEGGMDAVGFIRPLICDPDMPGKAKNGNFDAIRICVRDNGGCLARTQQMKPLGCIQNPEAGNENQSLVPMTVKAKKVWVVGAGPAGMEAALTCAKRGHQVKIFEKEKRPGGQINLQVKAAGRQPMGWVIRFLEYELQRHDVPIVTSTLITREMVVAKRPDAVIIATGSCSDPKPVPGSYEPPLVQNVRDILLETYPVKDRVLFVDENGSHHASATVEKLADQGKKVDMITSDLFIGVELAACGDLYLTRQRLLQKGVTFTTDVRVERIEAGNVFARQIFTHESVIYDDYGTIVLDMGEKPDDALYFGLKGQVDELVRVGDCVAPRTVGMAILEGRKAGESL